MSLSSLVSGVPATTKRFSLTENWAIGDKENISKSVLCLLTLWSLEMDDGVVVLEHVDLLNVGQVLDSYIGEMECKDLITHYLPNFLTADLSLPSSWTVATTLTFLVRLSVP